MLLPLQKEKSNYLSVDDVFPPPTPVPQSHSRSASVDRDKRETLEATSSTITESQSTELAVSQINHPVAFTSGPNSDPSTNDFPPPPPREFREDEKLLSE